MADPARKTPGNVPGRWFVDDTCTSCNLCVDLQPEIFAMDDDSGFAYVRKQPEGADEEAKARDAAGQCPVEAIGEDGA